MPLSGYYKGDGPQVMSSMKKRYGQKGGERAFYAVANKQGMNPGGDTRTGLSDKAASLGAKHFGQSKAELKKKVRPKPKKKVRSARAKRELARDPGDLVLSGKGTRAQERKRDPRGYLA